MCRIAWGQSTKGAFLKDDTLKNMNRRLLIDLKGLFLSWVTTTSNLENQPTPKFQGRVNAEPSILKQSTIKREEGLTRNSTSSKKNTLTTEIISLCYNLSQMETWTSLITDRFTPDLTQNQKVQCQGPWSLRLTSLSKSLISPIQRTLSQTLGSGAPKGWDRESAITCSTPGSKATSKITICFNNIKNWSHARFTDN